GANAAGSARGGRRAGSRTPTDSERRARPLRGSAACATTSLSFPPPARPSAPPRPDLIRSVSRFDEERRRARRERNRSQAAVLAVDVERSLPGAWEFERPGERAPPVAERRRARVERPVLDARQIEGHPRDVGARHSEQGERVERAVL